MVGAQQLAVTQTALGIAGDQPVKVLKVALEALGLLHPGEPLTVVMLQDMEHLYELLGGLMGFFMS